MKKFLTIILSVTVLVGSFPQLISSQNCGCASETDYCSVGSESGTCSANSPVSVADVVTDAFFNGIADQAASICAGKGFYTRSAFLEALNSYSQFGTVGSVEVSKREIAAFFAHVTLSTDHLCYVEQRDGPSKDYCDENNTQYPCVPGKGYYGRGPIQLSWNSNYGPAGQSIGFNGLSEPEIVATNNVISFKSSLWYWMKNCHSLITSGQGFGATIRCININECDGAREESVGARVKFYTEFCNQLGVEPGDNLRC